MVGLALTASGGCGGVESARVSAQGPAPAVASSGPLDTAGPPSSAPGSAPSATPTRSSSTSPATRAADAVAESGSGPRTATAGAGRPGPPRVFMAMHGSNVLAEDDRLDGQWAFVRKNLNGIWANNVGVSLEEQARLYRKIATRTIITEQPLGSDLSGRGWPSVERYAGVQARYPDVKLDREAVALYTKDAQRWTGRSIAEAKAEFVSNPGVPSSLRYRSVYTGWQPMNWDPSAPMPRAAAAAAGAAGGMFVECPRGLCANPKGAVGGNFRRAIRAAHADGQPFVWFASSGGSSAPTSGWLTQFQATYDALRAEGLWRESDVVMIINYHGTYRTVPETVGGRPADTVTGMAYWALRQRW